MPNEAGINDSGEIAAYGVNGSGEEDAFPLVPLPELGALRMVGFAMVLGMVGKRRFGGKSARQ